MLDTFAERDRHKDEARLWRALAEYAAVCADYHELRAARGPRVPPTPARP